MNEQEAYKLSLFQVILLLKLLPCCLMNLNCLVALLIIIEIWWLKVKPDVNVGNSQVPNMCNIWQLKV